LRKLVLLCSGLLFFVFCIQWWILYISPFNIPSYIRQTPINIGGLLLGASFILLFIWLFKKLLFIKPDLPVWKLSGIGILVTIIAECPFQLLRQFNMKSDTIGNRIYYFSLGTLGISILSGVVAFLIAFQLKTKKTNLLILFIILFMGGCYLIQSLVLPS
jgi:hypothetical protein